MRTLIEIFQKIMLLFFLLWKDTEPSLFVGNVTIIIYFTMLSGFAWSYMYVHLLLVPFTYKVIMKSCGAMVIEGYQYQTEECSFSSAAHFVLKEIWSSVSGYKYGQTRRPRSQSDFIQLWYCYIFASQPLFVPHQQNMIYQYKNPLVRGQEHGDDPDSKKSRTY